LCKHLNGIVHAMLATPAYLLAAAEVAILLVEAAPVAAPADVAEAATLGNFPAAAAEPSAEPIVAADAGTAEISLKMLLSCAVMSHLTEHRQ
jgi:hypothetical protein